ncbi:MAG: NifU family protein [Sphingobacteriales bacterium]|nr:NifU family protein [Sphingobacteriales bacterium]
MNNDDIQQQHCDDLLQKAREALLPLQPYFEADGGAVEVLRLTEEGVLQVKLLGNCESCRISMMTTAGMEQVIRAAVPEIKRVEAVAV